MSDDIESLTLSSQVVLLTLGHLSGAGETPAHTGEVIRASTEFLEGVQAEMFGKVSEAEVSRSLNRLEAEGYVEMATPDETSPVGKGRPVYELAMDPQSVIDTFAEQATFAPLIQQLNGEE